MDFCGATGLHFDFGHGVGNEVEVNSGRTENLQCLLSF